MLRHAVVSLVLVSLASILVFGVPILEIAHPVFDFNCIPEGSLVYHKFLLHNLGDEALVIVDIGSSCGCTVPSLPSQIIGPGESLSLEVTFRSAGYGGLAVSQSIHLETNDPTNPQRDLFLVGAVTPAESYFVIPAYVPYFIQLLIDIRDEESYASGHLLGAINIPENELEIWMDRIPRDLSIILYDQDGMTSGSVVQVFLDAGFRQVAAVLGGLNYAEKSLDAEYLVRSTE